MNRNAVRLSIALAAAVLVITAVPAIAQWVTRDHRWPPRGAWNWAIPRELPQLYREFNGVDFGHAHLAETLLRTQDGERVERARLEILDFIFSSPAVPPDEEQVAPTLVRMVWETQRAFNWAQTFHRSLYDLFASDRFADKESTYRKLLGNYLEKPEGITSHRLDHHGKLWSFPESKSFRTKFPKFNTQIWAYHWLQAAAYDVQLQGDARRRASSCRRSSPTTNAISGGLRWSGSSRRCRARPAISTHAQHGVGCRRRHGVRRAVRSFSVLPEHGVVVGLLALAGCRRPCGAQSPHRLCAGYRDHAA
jgi:hypothetical protein